MESERVKQPLLRSEGTPVTFIPRAKAPIQLRPIVVITSTTQCEYSVSSPAHTPGLVHSIRGSFCLEGVTRKLRGRGASNEEGPFSWLVPCIQLSAPRDLVFKASVGRSHRSLPDQPITINPPLLSLFARIWPQIWVKLISSSVPHDLRSMVRNLVLSFHQSRLL